MNSNPHFAVTMVKTVKIKIESGNSLKTLCFKTNFWKPNDKTTVKFQIKTGKWIRFFA